MTQISLFDGDTPLKITKPIRLIELFAGYGSQSLALKYLKVPFEHWKICEWAVKSIQAYKDLHFGDDTCDYSKAYSVDELIEMLREHLPTDLPVVFISAVTGKGLGELKDVLWRELNSESNKLQGIMAEDTLVHRDKDMTRFAAEMLDEARM